MKFKFFNYLCIFLIQAIAIGQNNKIESLDQRKFIAWEVHHMPYHILVEDAIVDFNDLNRNSTKIDTFKTLKPDEQLIIVQNKANDTEIHEISATAVILERFEKFQAPGNPKSNTMIRI